MARTNVRELARYPLGADITNSATSLTVGTLVSGSAVDVDSVPFYAVLEDDTTNEESVLVTAISGTTWTVVRAQESSTGVAHSAGASIVVGESAAEAQRQAGAGDLWYWSGYIAGGQSTGSKAGPIHVAPHAGRQVYAWAYLKTANAGSTFLIDFEKNGTALGSGSRVTIADGATTATSKNAGAGVAVAQGDLISINNVQVGSGTAGSDLSWVVVFERT